jgi:hypothetical protein
VSASRGWLVVAPWYRWRRQGLPARMTRPVLQKYDTSNPVAAFLADPQHCLKFNDEDLVHSVVPLPPLPALGSPMEGLKRRLSGFSSVPTDLRKIYLDSHKRFYLVVCELRADDPGFPCVDHRDVCEAGFVIRRRRTVYPAAAEDEVRGILRDLATASADLTRARIQGPPVRLAIVRSTDSGGAPVPVADSSVSHKLVAARRGRVDTERQRLADWATRVGAQQLSQGWVPSPGFAGIGCWQDVPAEPQTLTETAVRLFPLVAGGTGPAAAAIADSATFYFGLLPTGSSDTEANGTARLDDRSIYEVRCFVRRHDPRCPRTGDPGDCQGELFWSRPTEPFRLASHFDLAGTGNRPVTVQLPDLKALEAETAALPVGRAAPFRLQAPPDSNLEFDVDTTTMQISAKAPGEAICSFAIPLITIVATFVLKLFLPIVVFAFQLWFLLRLRFCIPPSVDVNLSLDAELAASADVDLDAGVQATLSADLDATIGAGAGAKLTGTYSNSVLVDLRKQLAMDLTVDGAPSVTDGLEFEEPELRLAASVR